MIRIDVVVIHRIDVLVKHELTFWLFTGQVTDVRALGQDEHMDERS